MTAPPGPSSLTETWRDSSAARRTVTRAPGAYLAAFVRDSQTRKYPAATTPSGMAGSGCGTRSTTSRLLEEHRLCTAASNPRSERILGWMPATVERRERRAASESSWALSRRRRTCAIRSGTTRSPTVAESSSRLASPTSMEAVTRNCWAPSCRSRSMRRRSISKAATISRRDSVSSATSSGVMLAKSPYPRSSAERTIRRARRRRRQPSPTAAAMTPIATAA